MKLTASLLAVLLLLTAFASSEGAEMSTDNFMDMPQAGQLIYLSGFMEGITADGDFVCKPFTYPQLLDGVERKVKEVRASGVALDKAPISLTVLLILFKDRGCGANKAKAQPK